MAKKIGVQVGQQYVNVHNTWKPTPVWEVKSIYPDDLGIDHAGLVNLKDHLRRTFIRSMALMGRVVWFSADS